MRNALVSLIAVGAVAMSVSAAAQETATTPAPEATPAPASAAEAPAAVPTPEAPAVADPAVVPEPAAPATTAVPATPEPEVTPEPSTAPPVVAEPTPVVVAPPAPEPEPVAPAPPPAPTDPVTIAVLNAVERLCVPLVQGGDVKALSTPLGYRKKKDAYTVVVAKPYQVTVLPQGSNTNVCTLQVDHAINGAEPLVVGLHNWAMARGWTLYRNDKFTTDLERHTRSWELAGEGQNEALVMISERKADGTPLLRNADRATILYSLTKTGQ